MTAGESCRGAFACVVGDIQQMIEESVGPSRCCHSFRVCQKPVAHIGKHSGGYLLRTHSQVIELGTRDGQQYEDEVIDKEGGEDDERRHLEFLETGDCVVAFRLKDNAGGDPWRNIIVVLNANSTPVEVKIPKGRYTEVCCDGSINEQGLGEIEGDAVTVSSQSALILHD